MISIHRALVIFVLACFVPLAGVTAEPAPPLVIVVDADNAPFMSDAGGVAGIYRNDSRADRYDYSEPIFTENVGVYYRQARPLDYRTLADLEGLKIGVIRNWLYGEDFDAAKKSGKIVAVATNSNRINFLKLARGRLDVVLSVEQSATAVIANEGLTGIQRSTRYFRANQAYLAFGKAARQSSLLAQFNATITEMKRDGTLQRIVAENLPE